MLSLRVVATGLSRYLSNELDLDPKEVESIRFGFEMILGAFLKALVIFGLSYWLDMLPQVLVALATSSVLRLLSGGVHCSSYLRCLVFGTSMMVLAGYLSVVFGSYFSTEGMVSAIPFISLLGGYVAHHWAAMEHPGDPPSSKEKRLRFKKLSFIFVVFWALFMLLLINAGFQKSIILASTGGLIVQLFSLTPVGYAFTGKVDGLLRKAVP